MPVDKQDQSERRCSCPEVYAGVYPTGSRNWSPNCPEHGEGTEWLRRKLATDSNWARWAMWLR